MSTDYFFGVTLSAANKELKWEPDELKENGSGDISLLPRGEHILFLRQAIISGGVEGELNVVEAETSGYKAPVKIPIAALVGGKSVNTIMDLSFPDPPVHLRLVEGSGPVHITGLHSIQSEQYNDDDDDDEDDYLDMDEEDDDEEDAEAESKPKVKEDKAAKKRVSGSPGQAQPSKKKKGSKEDA